jgi:putative transposase
LGLTEYFVFYNHKRPHQSLSDRTPEAVYQSVAGGGAKIVDRFGEAELKLGQRQTAAIEKGSPA